MKIGRCPKEAQSAFSIERTISENCFFVPLIVGSIFLFYRLLSNTHLQTLENLEIISLLLNYIANNKQPFHVVMTYKGRV